MLVRAVSCDSAGGSLRSGLQKRAALIGASAVVLAACSPGPGPSPSATPSSCTQGVSFNPSDFHPCWLAANVNAGGAPVYGGTLKIEGDEDASAFLDPQGEYGAVGAIVERAFTRQLVTYPASTNLVTSEKIVPDAATAMPTVSADGRTYTFHIKTGVMWNTSPPRQVTSQDFKRGIERTCDPTLSQYGNPSYYTATILGFSSFCTAFEAMDPATSAGARAAYINGHDVPGIQTPDSSTIVFTLTEPAIDFPNILALPFASAAPVEDLSYIPVTPHNPLYSDGPYEIKTYVISKAGVGEEIDLDHNLAWRQSTDTIRHDYVKYIDIKLDMTGSAVPEGVQAALTIGAADLEWDTQVPTDDVDGLMSPSWDARYGVFPAPGYTRPMVRFNVLSPNNNRALGKIKVRQALEYAINKVAIGDIFGGPSLTQPLNQVIGPGAEGYAPIDDYPTKDNEGDPGKCKRLLAAAGYPNGLTLKDIYIAYLTVGPQVAQEVQSDFAKCGVTVKGIPIATGPADFAGPSGTGASADVLKEPGTWDFTPTTGWGPDWYGPTNGRAILPDLFTPPAIGGYDDHAVDTLVTEAEAALTPSEATSYWHQADEKVMADAAFIPVETQLVPLFRSARVHNAIFSNISQTYDITQVWLSS